MLLQMAELHSFYGLVVFYQIYILHLLYPLVCWWALRLLPYLDGFQSREPSKCFEHLNHWKATLFFFYFAFIQQVLVFIEHLLCWDMGKAPCKIDFSLYRFCTPKANRSFLPYKCHQLAYIYFLTSFLPSLFPSIHSHTHPSMRPRLCSKKELRRPQELLEGHHKSALLHIFTDFVTTLILPVTVFVTLKIIWIDNIWQEVLIGNTLSHPTP